MSDSYDPESKKPCRLCRGRVRMSALDWDLLIFKHSTAQQVPPCYWIKCGLCAGTDHEGYEVGFELAI